jgi:hypothetical protein
VLLLLYIALMYDYSQRRAFTHLRFLNRK